MLALFCIIFVIIGAFCLFYGEENDSNFALGCALPMFVVGIICLFLFIFPPMISSTKVVDIVPVQNGINDYCMSSDKNYIVNDGKQAYNCLMEDTIFVKGKASLTITKEEVRKNVDWLYIQDPEFTYIISIP